MTEALFLPNGGRAPLSSVPFLSFQGFRKAIVEGVDAGGRLAALFGSQEEGVRLYGVLAWKNRALLSVVSTRIEGRYPSLTPTVPQAHLFEREIAELWEIEPTGHPWLKPVRFASPYGKGENSKRCGEADFFSIVGEEIHEVAVGPVHAGIIEPGHFRFQCHGETVHHLEILLGYQHRGIEKALMGGPDKRSLGYMETLAGDTTIGHGSAYCRIYEALTETPVPARAQALRGIALELERIANHIGDLGALAGDVGFLPTMSYCGRIRGDVLNLTGQICGSRFGRRLLIPGGVRYDLDDEQVEKIKKGLKRAVQEAEEAVGLLWKSSSVLARFEGTGALSREVAEEIGLVGVAARACGIETDVRSDFPYDIYQFFNIPTVTWHTGDVFARAFVRSQEIRRSAEFVLGLLESLPAGEIHASTGGPLQERQLVLSLVEGWRGEIFHGAVTDRNGRFSCYKVVDPSFHNWFGLAMALRNRQISDFPLCNKSFNLSYCGHDL